MTEKQLLGDRTLNAGLPAKECMEIGCDYDRTLLGFIEVLLQSRLSPEHVVRYDS